ncbi:hypothetical protein TrST_g13151 [Triparma strigata]|uniref:Uncharacterized protein n=1 Tax=Triparma strigata TaxID=1606541 RepID=A0A9W7BWN5_9STRA|nr:hypothetical protein TrST_g13151 [Triparma strigata]
MISRAAILAIIVVVAAIYTNYGYFHDSETYHANRRIKKLAEYDSYALQGRLAFEKGGANSVELEQALRYYSWAKDGYEGLLGPEDEKVFKTEKSLLLITVKDNARRVSRLKELADRAENALGFENIVTLDIMNTLAIEIDDKNGQDKRAQNEAKSILERCLKGQERVYEYEHEDMMMTVMNLGNIYFAKREHEKALEFYMRALKGQQATLGKTHTSSLTSMMNIANVLNDGIQDFAQAETYYKGALEGFESQLGRHHRFTLVTAANYKNCLTKLVDIPALKELERRFPSIADERPYNKQIIH